mmetsp:Transcript_26146/g.41461  ORF Transcript_26146/g.41461 Transcript_26146/m.41461 type:complete len:251 (-) Transcript_26146:341-1093(-)
MVLLRQRFSILHHHVLSIKMLDTAFINHTHSALLEQGNKANINDFVVTLRSLLCVGQLRFDDAIITQIHRHRISVCFAAIDKCAPFRILLGQLHQELLVHLIELAEIFAIDHLFEDALVVGLQRNEVARSARDQGDFVHSVLRRIDGDLTRTVSVSYNQHILTGILGRIFVLNRVHDIAIELVHAFLQTLGNRGKSKRTGGHHQVFRFDLLLHVSLRSVCDAPQWRGGGVVVVVAFADVGDSRVELDVGR